MADPPRGDDTGVKPGRRPNAGTARWGKVSTRGASRWQKVIAILGLLVVAWVGNQVYEVVSLDGSGTGELGLHGPGPGEAPTETPEPTGDPTPPAAPGSLPQEFFECVADQGFDIEAEAEIHSVPPQVLQACFGALHGGG